MMSQRLAVEEIEVQALAEFGFGLDYGSLRFGAVAGQRAVFGFADVSYLQVVEVVHRLDVLKDGFDGVVQGFVLAVVGFAGKIDDIAFDEVECVLLVLGCIDGDGKSAFGTEELHAGDVCQAVTEIDHVSEGDAPLAPCHKVVDLLVVANLLDALVNHGDDLDLGGEVNRCSRPYGKAIVVVHEAVGIDVLELVRDR